MRREKVFKKIIEKIKMLGMTDLTETKQNQKLWRAKVQAMVAAAFIATVPNLYVLAKPGPLV